MKETKLRTFGYDCKCGYQIRVFLDYGIPQEFHKCRKCGCSIRRKEL